MIVVVDVGNTTTAFGLFEGAKVLACFRFTTTPHRTRDEYMALLSSMASAKGYKLENVEGVVIGSVVPDATKRLVEMAKTYLGKAPLTVNGGIKNLPVKVRVEEPLRVGADRIANASAAYALYGRGEKATVVVDFGTALSFDVVDRHGNFLGGAISPGVEISAKALFKGAAKLFEVELSPPEKLIGDNTAEALRIGIIRGFVHLIRGLIADFSAGLGEKPLVIVTGGQSTYFRGMLDGIWDDLLTLKGLAIIWEHVVRGGWRGPDPDKEAEGCPA